MTAYTVEFMFYIFLTIAATQSNSNPNLDKKCLPKHGHKVKQYSMLLVKCHKLCSSCVHKDTTPRDLVRFPQDANPMVTHNRNRIRSARNPVAHDGQYHQFLRRKFLAQRIPFMIPIDNLFTNINYQIKTVLYGTQPKSKANVNNRYNQEKMIPHEQLRNTSQALQTILTQISLTRRIRSTVITAVQPSTPALSSTTMVKITPVSKTETEKLIVSSATTPYPKVFVKIIVRTTTTRTVLSKNHEFKTTVLIQPEVLRNNTSTMRTVPKFSHIPSTGYMEKTPFIQQQFSQALDQFERKFYTATFGKLSSISPLDRRENGISFVESGLFLFLVLCALSMEVDKGTKSEIDSSLALDVSNSDKIKMIKRLLDELPPSSDELKFRWSTRLVVNGSWQPTYTAEALRLHLDRLDGNETSEQLLQKLNHMVEEDSGGAMRDTFEEDEVDKRVGAALISTMYLRARWRSAPTLLNGTHPFRDADGAPPRTTRMIRVNDIMRYADLPEWDAQAVQISYATPGLSLLLLVPRGRSLRAVSEWAASVSVSEITAKMRPLRVAVILPIYTLRMTLLLPNKLQAIGISRLVAPSNATDAHELRLSHAVQRVMFWAEAGRNAFKDDGIEWDLRPELEIMVDRPYLFYVRWRNLTLLNGNFVL